MEGFYSTDLAPLTSDDSSEPFPHFFVGHEAFQLQKNLMRLYSWRCLTKACFQLQAFLRLEECQVCLWDAYFKVPHFQRTYVL